MVDEEAEQPDQWFEPYRISQTEAAKALVGNVTQRIEAEEQTLGLRKRARRPADRESFTATVSAVTSDLAYHYLTGHSAVAITRSHSILGKRSRYRPPAYGKTLPDLLDLMARPAVGLLVQRVGERGPLAAGGKRTTISAGPVLRRLIKELRLSPVDFGVASSSETIFLKRGKEDRWDQAVLVDYADTPLTDRYRHEMSEINEWLAVADISLTGRPSDGSVIDLGRRRLRRSFTQESFESGGRLFGGFWMDMRREDRQRLIEIGGEPVIGLDYGQLAPRVVYGLSSQTPPSSDIYAIPRLIAYREGIKKFMNAMLFAPKPLERKPQGTRKLLPKNYSAKEITQAINDAHPAIAHQFHTGIGHRVQFIESSILVDALLRLKASGIVALPIHDAILIPLSAQNLAHRVMSEVFHEAVGIPAIVKVEHRIIT